jgi:hypothetical protein
MSTIYIVPTITLCEYLEEVTDPITLSALLNIYLVYQGGRPACTVSNQPKNRDFITMLNNITVRYLYTYNDGGVLLVSSTPILKFELGERITIKKRGEILDYQCADDIVTSAYDERMNIKFYEMGISLPIYNEVCSRKLFAPDVIARAYRHAQLRVQFWNNIMVRSGLKYRFNVQLVEL